MNIGFIGVGGVAQPHLQNLSAMEGVRISAVCDIVSERVAAAGAKYDAHTYSDYHQMLESEKLDACYVCVIPGAHASIELDLAKARLPFYAEKPVHLDLDACQRVIDELQKSGMVNSVGYHWRYTAAAQALKKFVEKQRVSFVEGWWYGGFVGAPWWRQMKLSGGQLVEQTTHIVDMARYLVGEVHTVFGAGATGAMTEVEHYDIHDASVCVLQFDSGAVGQITSGCIAEKHGGSRVDITVKGRDWSAWTNASKATIKSDAGDEEVESGQSWQEQLGNGDRAFVAAVKSGDGSKILSPYISGAQTLAITLAANESMRTGQPVNVRRFV
ncbi:MAG TPA: Gfo/Idh/MocA family oxidoreductase [Armatimonadota bacterium]|nr:Gfo/Idh/MocA family oxidoreductase [Armatimonadota bacterium]